MAKFTFQPTVPTDSTFSAKLGTDTVANGGGLTDADVGKFVKLVAPDTYGLCAEGDPIEGILVSLEPATIDGYSFGTVAKEDLRIKVQLQGAVSFGNFVVAGAPLARGVKQGATLPKVKASATPTQPGVRPWRTISGGTADGAAALIEFIW
jgi:hypothetical protein